MAATVALREYVCKSGNAILLCPLQYQTSPKVTCSMDATVVLRQPVQVAVTV